MGRQILLVVSVIVASLPLCTEQAAAAEKRPNVVILLADDLGYGDLGCYGCPDIKTPNLDRLARQGVRFTSYYTNGPECSPTRTALLTGRYQHRVGGLECAIGLGNVGRYDDAIRLRESHELGLPPEHGTLAPTLKAAGYATAVTGKWHLGYEARFLPDRHAFDYSFGPLGGSVDYFHHREPGGEPMLYQNGKPIRREGYMTDLIATEAVEFVRRAKDGPFLLYVPFTAPHDPFQGPNDRKESPVTLSEGSQGSREVFRTMVERLDQGIGQVLEALEQAGVAANTLVIFASDNGGPKFARNVPFSGNKGGLFEGGIRVPCIVRWPGVLEPGTTNDSPAMTIDLTASIIRAAGATPPKDKPLDGIEILQMAAKKQAPTGRTMFWRARRGERTWKAVRDGTLKYISRTDGDRTEEYAFDLASDPQEKQNLLNDRMADVSRLRQLLASWEAIVRHSR